MSSAVMSALVSSPSPTRLSALWLERKLAEAKLADGGVLSLVIELTPVLAEVLLERNNTNRKLSEVMLRRYVEDIEKGNWSFNGEPIIIADDGFLNDGQHRCTAVVRAQRPIRVLLVIGVARETRLTIDQGKAREIGDYLAMDGRDDARALGSAGSYMVQYRDIGMLSTHTFLRPTKAEIMTLVNASPDLAKWVAWTPKKGSYASGRGLLAFCLCVIARTGGHDRAKAFGEAMINGAGLEAGSPILYARNRIAAERARLRPNGKAELIFRAWNAHCRGDSVRTLPVFDKELPALERPA